MATVSVLPAKCWIVIKEIIENIENKKISNQKYRKYRIENIEVRKYQTENIKNRKYRKPKISKTKNIENI